MYNYGDKVRIIATGEVGEICDISTVDGMERYIVDTWGKSYVDEKTNILDYLIHCDVTEIEKIK